MTALDVGWRGNPADLIAAAEPDHAAFVRHLIARLPAWHRHAACVGQPTAMFFPERGQSNQPALEVCARCPVRQQCLDDALASPRWCDVGIRGGTSAKQRRQMRQALPDDSTRPTQETRS